MGFRKSDCQGDCRWKATDPYWTHGGDAWDWYADCMDMCNEVFNGIPGKDDGAFTTPWPVAREDSELRISETLHEAAEG